ncbi:MAG TPA: molybdopterin-dependent oxidoreductase [Candidatus Limnocylindria bacterium]|nr:molybdopterin-dependent oxidoreductase [Candidatus Limnocylindria bacterium]
MASSVDEWRHTACILCECNCGLEVQLGGPGGRHIEKVRGDRAHPASRGYACEKAHRIDYYQNGPDRVTAPLRRRPDGTFEEIDWDTAIGEVAAGLLRVRDTAGPEAIFYFGGGGQGNHLPGGYAAATMRALGAVYRSNALAQEKTGEFWVNGRMLGAPVRGDFEHAEVALFIGKNPYQSHGMPRARVTLKEIARDPGRTLIVVDPRRSETAELADIHLQVRPGRDAWLLAALVGVLVQEKLMAERWLAEHATGVDEIVAAFEAVPVARYCEIAGVPEDLVRRTARRIAGARSVAVAEDLGIQMNRHSTLNSYLEKLLWLLTGNFAVPGAQYVPAMLVNLASSAPDGVDGGKPARTSPVVGARIISGLVPCNVIPDEILTDHPRRYRAMVVESGNPAHSLADSQRMRQALRALELLVVIDVAMTETARLAHYVLPVPSQYEKYEATFFNFDFPENAFHLRRPLFEAPAGTLPEAEIHARLVEAIGFVTPADLAPLAAAAAEGRAAFAQAFFAALAANPKLERVLPVVLYRTLGPTLPNGAAAAAPLWGICQLFALHHGESLRRAGFTGENPGEQLFDAILASPSGVVFAVDEYDVSWRRVRTPDGKLRLVIPELLAELAVLGEEPVAAPPELPLVLSAGERRSWTANTIFRDPRWRKKDADGALRVSPADAMRIGLRDGGRARLTTKRGSVETVVEVSPMMQPGHVSLPNGLGCLYPDEAGRLRRPGVAPNELTASEDRDPIAGTPWHKHVPARVEALD